MAEDVLRLSGLIENVNYRKQRGIEGGVPDFTFFLPNDLLLHMDVKFPLDNYVRCVEAESELDERRFRDDFLRDVRGHVKALASRSYIDPAGGTVDFVLLFIPNDTLYTFIHEHDETIVDEAAGRHVVFCSPLTLFAVLALIRQTIDNVALARDVRRDPGPAGHVQEAVARRSWTRWTSSTARSAPCARTTTSSSVPAGGHSSARWTRSTTSATSSSSA